MTANLSPVVRDADVSPSDDVIKPPQNLSTYELETVVAKDGVLKMTYNSVTSNTVHLHFDAALEAGTSVQLVLQSGWAIERSDPRLRWTTTGSVWTAHISRELLYNVVMDGAGYHLHFSFRSDTGKVHDPVIIVDRPPPQQQQH